MAVLKKGKSDNSTFFIDASREFIKITNSNKLTDKNIVSVLDAYTSRTDSEYFARLVPNSEISEQEYNLSVSSYVVQEDTREVIDIKVLNAEIDRIVASVDNLRRGIDEIVWEIDGGRAYD